MTVPDSFRHRGGARIAAAVAGGTLVLTVTACAGTAGPEPDGAPPTVVTAEPALPGPPPTPGHAEEAGTGPVTAAEVRAQGAPQPRLAGLTTHLLDGLRALDVASGPDGERWTLTPEPAHARSRMLLVAAPEGGTFEVLADGSVVVAPASGAPATLGVAPLAAGTSELVAPDLLAVRADPAAPGGPVEVWFGHTAVESATWGENEGGRSLAVVPTPWARAAGEAGVVMAWRELAAHGPEAAGAGMHDQLVCHAVGAPDKASWNLEPWRPDVGLLPTMLAECNPT